ncbi:hypothetical protein BJ508DRAFT_36525 [Ascobolus immersus RN42]|uniref:Uncharacterized protein n=1 Tax=Ascobolus immersus RN42 TaxID=1160509 RepID=A0A3N4IDU1_ASCIM|nr:hypothetical protein BJ508DRAFT_36525 [Ascobolus immersus RN42]
MDRELWKTNATVTSINDMVLVYDFNPVFLLVPYGIAFGISLILIVIGLYALRNNGVPAAGTSFLQIVSTTSAPGCDSLRTAAAECSLGGEKNFSEKLLELPLKFGEIVSNGSGDIGRGGSDGDSGGAGDGKTGVAYNTTIAGSGWGGTKLLGFGTFGEVITMKRKGQ